MFKRKPRSYSQMASDMVYPRGGWLRAGQYMVYRMRRLPDNPQRIGRGVAAGVFISFTPLFGIHLLGGMALAWLTGGNILASVFGGFLGNPVTIPFIAIMSVSLGRWMLGIDGSASAGGILAAFSSATNELISNLMAVFDGRTVHWEDLANFFEVIFLPYLVGGFLPGVAAAILAHYLTVPVVTAYHKRRIQQMRKRAEQRARLMAEAAALQAARQAPPPSLPPESRGNR